MCSSHDAGSDSNTSPSQVSKRFNYLSSWIDEAMQQRLRFQMLYYHLTLAGRQFGFTADLLARLSSLDAQMNALDIAADGCLKELWILEKTVGI